jgi:hypothetical protein
VLALLILSLELRFSMPQVDQAVLQTPVPIQLVVEVKLLLMVPTQLRVLQILVQAVVVVGITMQ